MGVLVAGWKLYPRLSAYGSLAMASALLVTQSFLITTPGLDLFSFTAGFLAKDLTLMGAALWCVGESLAFASEVDGSPVVL